MNDVRTTREKALPLHIKRFHTPTLNTSAWKSLVARYQVPSTRRGIWQLGNSVFPFLLMWYLMYRSLEISYWLTLLLAIPTAGLLIRIFIIQHDCGHASFMRWKRVNDLIGSICGILTFTPYQHWRKQHAIHHATNSDLERRGTGDIWTMTVEEYKRETRWGRFKYRLYRHPLVLFVIGPSLMLMIFHRLPPRDSFTLRDRERASILWTNLALGAGTVALTWALGIGDFLRVQLPIMVVAASVGTWLFYVQHQFEDVYWSKDRAWDYYTAAIRGSSYYKLPQILQWFTGNIGFHHVHHLSHRIPNYLLQKCHEENPDFQQATVLTLWSSLRTMDLALWDEKKRKLVRFRDAA